MRASGEIKAARNKTDKKYSTEDLLKVEIHNLKNIRNFDHFVVEKLNVIK